VSAAPDIDDNSPVTLLLKHLQGVRSAGSGWTARCPAHDDRKPSLSVGTGADGRALVCCHAGCLTEAVVRTVGLAMADLFPAATRQGRRVVRTHRYRDATGEVLYAIRRLEAPTGPRSWSMVRPDGEMWVRGAGDRRVLYRLPQLLAGPHNDPVYVTEGERDADTLAEAGLTATTVTSGSWAKTDASALAGRGVIVIVDNDAAGWERGRTSVAAIGAAGGCVLHVWRPPPEFKDISDALEAGLTITDCLPADLDAEPPVKTTPAVHRSAFLNGLAYYVLAPAPVLLAMIQNGKLRPNDLAIWLYLEQRAGKTELALTDATECAAVTRIGRHSAGASLKRLAAAGLVAEVQRGQWRVFNPARPGRRGGVSPTLTFVERVSATNPFPLRTPTTNPASGRKQTTRRPKNDHSPAPERSKTGHSEAAPVTASDLVEAFPGAWVEHERA
jgi:hypothetical protein